MHYRRCLDHPPGEQVDASTPVLFFAFFASSREEFPDLGSWLASCAAHQFDSFVKKAEMEKVSDDTLHSGGV
jgi:hypothetical protein